MVDSSRLHIMHLVRSGFAGGGMENGIVNVTNRLPQEHFRISLCALDSKETFSGRVHLRDFCCYLLPKTRPGIDWPLIGQLVRLCRRTQVDVIHSHNSGTFLYAVPAAKWTGIPVIHGEHGKNLAELVETNRPKYWAKRLLGPRVDRLVTVSETIAWEWAAYGVPESRIKWIPNGVDVERFRPREGSAEFRRQFGLPEAGYLVGSVGRFDPIKDYDVLVDAFAQLLSRLPDAHLTFVGDGPDEAALRAKAIQLGVQDRVYWLGRRPNPEDFLPALDVFVLPSRSEGMSNVVLEAMACGLPVVCADLPGHREVFEPGHEGFVVSPCQGDKLAATLSALAQDPGLRRDVGAAARKKVLARFQLDRMAADYQALYGQFQRPVTLRTVAPGFQKT